MKITLEIPEEEYKRYKQYYDPYIIKETPNLRCDHKNYVHGGDGIYRICFGCGELINENQ